MLSRKLKKLSIVVPCHNEGQNPVLLSQELLKVCAAMDCAPEIIFVDDSSDGSEKFIEQECDKSGGHVKLVKLARSFGQSMAIFAGLDLCTGDACVVMDCDFEDPPDAIPLLVAEWSKGSNIVLARRKRKGLKASYKFFQALYYKLNSILAEIEIPAEVGEFRMLDRDVIQHLRLFPERAKFFRGLSLWLGFKYSLVDVERNERLHGQTQYNFVRASSVAIDGLVSFSFLPLRMIALAGVLIGVISFFLSLGYLVWRISDPKAFSPGWASLFLLQLFSTGVILFFLGVVAEYVGRIFQQVQGRPAYVIEYKKGFTA